MLCRNVLAPLAGLLLAGTLSLGCELTDAHPEEPVVDPESVEMVDLFEVHLREGFENDSVKVILDDHLVYQNRVTTMRSLSLAGIIATPIIKGEHKISIIINSELSRDTTFTNNDTLIIAVWFSDRSSIEYEFQDYITYYI
jgi:hypothetical protein